MNIDQLMVPIKNAILRRDAVKKDMCPDCGRDLDTGWECNGCDFDGRPLIEDLLEKGGEW